MQMRVFHYGEGMAVAVCEGFLGDGLGARVWLAAQVRPETEVTPSTAIS